MTTTKSLVHISEGQILPISQVILKCLFACFLAIPALITLRDVSLQAVSLLVLKSPAKSQGENQDHGGGKADNQGQEAALFNEKVMISGLY
jgi:hypothetical protein